MQKLNNKVALITGGTSGIGYATAREFIREGAKVMITGRNRQTLDEAVESLGENAYGIVSDAGKMSDVFDLRKQVAQHADHLDVLFVNAGYGRFAPVEMVSEELYDELFNMLAKGTFFTIQQLLPLMPDGSSIIMNTSVLTEAGYSNMSVYSAAKSAVQSFIRTFAAEYAAKNIRVNGISPGYINTNIFDKTGLTPEQISSVIAGVTPTLPFKRFGEPYEIAKTAVFLASADASYIHGVEITVDGGLSRIK